MTTLKDVIASTLAPYVGTVDAKWHDLIATDITNAVITYQGDETFELRTRRNAPATSKTGIDQIKAGTAQAQVLNFFQSTGRGWTDDELETATGRSHQSVSSVRNILMNKGYVRDSGELRPTRSGNDAIVYVYTGKGIAR